MDVLINKEGIRDKDELEQFERMASARRLETLPHNLPITPQGYREIHRYMLQDVYDWAGQDRLVNTGRGPAPFCRVDFIDAQLNERFAIINAEKNLQGLDADKFATRTAIHMNELNAIHPFLDGNGRTQRAFLGILAEQAAHRIELVRISPDAWNKASIQGFYGQNNQMRDVIAAAIVPRTRHHQQSRDQAQSGRREAWKRSGLSRDDNEQSRDKGDDRGGRGGR